MKRPRSATPKASTARRIRWALWIALSLLFQNAVVTQHALAMATGVEVCSASGPVRVDADGHPLTGGSGGCHACCLAADLAAPPAPPPPALLEANQLAPQQPCAPAQPPAPWLGPLSRGPPAGA